MAGSFISPDGDIESLYITDYNLIDRYVTTGTAWGWGLNSFGQVGDNTSTTKSSPVLVTGGGQNWKSVTAGLRLMAGIKTDGTLWMWGSNQYGGIGNSTTANSFSSPVQTVAGGTNWKMCFVGNDHTVAIKTDGTLWTWGLNTTGALGDNTQTHASSPIQTIAGGTNWKNCSATYQSSYGIKLDGTLWAWGSNANGQLGVGNTVARSSPTQVANGGTTWKTLSTPGGSYQGMAAIKTDGTLWAWGANNYWQLGTGDTTVRNSPVQNTYGGNWKYIITTTRQSAGIKTDGTLWVWGQNSNGNLGTNDITNYSSPVQTIAGGTDWRTVAMSGVTSSFWTGAIKTDGTLWVWGTPSTNGQMGTNSTTPQSSPVQTIAGGKNWKQISIGTNTGLALYFYDAGDLYPK